jgi:diguanylate cyclase
MAIDIDGLKLINDIHGHRTGDAAIRETALRIGRIPRKEDTVARIVGDESGVLLDQAHSRDDVVSVACRIREEIKSPFEFEGSAVNLRVSIGTAYYPDDGRDANTLMEVTDRSMYTVKRGRSKPLKL